MKKATRSAVPPLAPRRGPWRSRDVARQRLVHAAARLFDEKGYFATDSNEIACRAGYAPATFYRYFADKRDVFLVAYATWVTDVWTAVRSLGPGASPSRVVRAVLAHHKRWAGFRASLVALSALDSKVRTLRARSRRKQALQLRRMFRTMSTARAVLLLLTFERLCDAVAWGELARAGVSDRQVGLYLVGQLAAGRRHRASRTRP